jgi:hypothetical protein
MPRTGRYIAIVREGEDIMHTFSIGGDASIDDLFNLVNDRPQTMTQIAAEDSRHARRICVHLDDAWLPTFLGQLDSVRESVS